jgi:hypothetical protein
MLPSKSRAYTWGRVELSESTKGYTLMLFIKLGVDKNVHSDEESGVTSLRCSAPL